jgi:hypothetical protein
VSFQLFGYRTESVTALYYAIMLVSIALYVVAYWRSPSRLLLVAAFLGMLYLTLPMVAYNPQLKSVLALRVLPALSMVACLHCLLFMGGSLRNRVSVLQIVLVAVQVSLIAFAMHLRTTALWQIITIVGFGVVVVGVASIRRLGVRTVPWRSTALAAGTTIVFAIAGYYGLKAYQAAALPEEYQRGEQIGTRVFWHNIFSGLAYHPDFAERYHLRIDDSSIFAATRDYLLETGRHDVWIAIGGEEAEDFQALKFAEYDLLAREMLVARCSTYVRECTEAMLYYKPVALIGNLAWLYGLRELPPNLDILVSEKITEGADEVKQELIRATAQLDAHGQRAYLWTPLVLLVLVPFTVLLTKESRQSIWVAFAALAGLTAGSLIPTVIGYPVPHTILETALAVGMFTYFAVCAAVAQVLPVVLSRVSSRTRAAEATAPLPNAAR